MQDWRKKLAGSKAEAPGEPGAASSARMAKPFGAEIEFHYARVGPLAGAAQLDEAASASGSAQSSITMDG